VVDVSAIAGLMSSLKAATDISKAMIDLRDGAMIQRKVIELQGVILAAQQSALSAQTDQFTMLERVRELEKEIARLRAWDAEKANYELKEISRGAFAYVLKPDAGAGEPPHWLCTSCYQKSHKAVLQYDGRTDKNDESIYKCPDCSSAVRVHWSRYPGKDQAETQAPPGEPCPLCGKPMKTKKVEPDPKFAFAGLQQHTLACECGHTEKRQVDPSNRTGGAKRAPQPR
jgi:hypothetical protein